MFTVASFGDFTLGASMSAAVFLIGMLIRTDRREVRLTKVIYAWLRVWVDTWGQEPEIVKARLMAVAQSLPERKGRKWPFFPRRS